MPKQKMVKQTVNNAEQAELLQSDRHCNESHSFFAHLLPTWTRYALMTLRMLASYQKLYYLIGQSERQHQRDSTLRMIEAVHYQIIGSSPNIRYSLVINVIKKPVRRAVFRFLELGTGGPD